MPEKDPSNYPLLTYLWVLLLSTWGGVASFLRNAKLGKARPFNIMELLGEVVISSFAGIVTFMLAQAADINSLLTAALVAISGHMGSRAIIAAETWAEKKFNFMGAKDDTAER